MIKSEILFIYTSDKIKELVILGDFMDMWVIPMSYHTFRDTINNDKEYFQGISNADINNKVISEINQITNEGIIRHNVSLYQATNKEDDSLALQLISEENLDTII